MSDQCGWCLAYPCHGEQYYYLTKTNWIVRFDRRDPGAGLRPYRFTSRKLREHLKTGTGELLDRDLGQAQRDAPVAIVTLELTESCNMRCEYCIYSGKYQQERCHSPRSMTSATIDDTFHYIKVHYPSLKKLHLCFYGGEPLLNMDALRYVTETVPVILPGVQVTYKITTNGLLLSRPVAAFLHRHRFGVQVSLDGPASVNDRYRKDVGGRGTHRRVMEGLRVLREAGVTSLSISCTLAPPEEMLKRTSFFNHRKLFRKSDIVLGTLVTSPDTAGACGSPKPNAPTEDNGLSDYLRRCQRVDRPFYWAQFESRYAKIHNRMDCDLYEENPFKRCLCPMGVNRMLIDVNGTIYPCEQSSRGKHVIGDIRKGLNSRVIHGINSRYLRFRERTCSSCWAVRLCDDCQLRLLDGEYCDDAIARAQCDGIRSSIRDRLNEYTALQSLNPTVLKDLENK